MHLSIYIQQNSINPTHMEPDKNIIEYSQLPDATYADLSSYT